MRNFFKVGLALLLGLSFCVPAFAAADDEVIQEVLGILKERGIVDNARYTELMSKNETYSQKHDKLLGRIELSGDMRGRFENFRYNQDAAGKTRSDRSRMRYRLRLKAKAEINRYIDAVFRIASGGGDPRSTNNTLGNGPDFMADPISIDMAYLQFNAPEEWLPATKATLRFGKTPNPFTWKEGKDYLVWDHDLNPEGAGVQLAARPEENLELLLNTGYFILTENSTSKNPSLFGLQAAAIYDVSQDFQMGVRSSWYKFSALDPAFFAGPGRAVAFGNIPDGLTNGAPTRRNDGANVVSATAFVRWNGIEEWPILVTGQFVRNLDAASSGLLSRAPGAEDTGWGASVEVGDKRKWVKAGLGYYHEEANYFPAQLTDSDLFDGFTNRRGWTLYLSRQIFANTDLDFTMFKSDAIRESLPDFAASTLGGATGSRFRFQADIVVKF